MTEAPILLSTPMVRSTLALIKKMTRRVKGLESINENPNAWSLIGSRKFRNKVTKETIDVRCPYGKVGGLLWVRETYYPSLEVLKTQVIFNQYKADFDGPVDWNWKPSIFMQKIHARIWLEITSIHIERLHDISEEDAKHEGAPDSLKQEDFKLLSNLNWKIKRPFLAHQFGFLALWCRLNGILSWQANPWVWVISFKVLSTKGKPLQLTNEGAHA